MAIAMLKKGMIMEIVTRWFFSQYWKCFLVLDEIHEYFPVLKDWEA
jgi:hypothetical protein